MYRRGDLDSRKAGAAIERVAANAFQPVGQRDVLKSGAASERLFPYACYRRRDIDGRKAGAVAERLGANALQPVWQRDGRKF